MEGKIIFVNSYKGGAGKTTLSLMHCIDDLFNSHKYTNVIYMDLDMLGTGTCYLFEDGKLPEEKCFEKTGKQVTVVLTDGAGETAQLYVTFLNPAFKGRSALGGNHWLNHQEAAEESLRKKVMDFIRECFKKVPNTLVVLDCAPGLARLEQKILKECYELAVGGNIEIQEEYVTTLDSAHIRKCIQCLNNNRVSSALDEKTRKIRMVINDMQNYEGYINDRVNSKVSTVTADEAWADIVGEIKKTLKNKAIEIYRWKYSKEIALRTTFKNERKLENQVDDYIFTSKNYRKC